MDIFYTTITIIQLLVSILSTPPNQSLTESQMRLVLTLSGWPVSLHDEALAVTWCESEWQWGAVGDGGWAVGLAQIHAFRQNEWTCEDTVNDFIGYYPYFHCTQGFTGDVFNPVTNMSLARLIYERNDGFDMWTCRNVLE